MVIGIMVLVKDILLAENLLPYLKIQLP